MQKKLIYISHWRFPSEKTMTPLILRTCAQFVRLGYEVELWMPRRHNEYREGEDVFNLYRISPRFTLRRLPVLDLMRPLGAVGFILMVVTFNVAVWWRLRGMRAILYAHDLRDVILPLLRGLPTFVEIHDFYETSWGFLNRFVFGRAAGLIVTNTHKLERLARRWSVPRGRMLLQQNAVDAGAFDIPQSVQEARAVLGLPQARRLALYAGHLFSWKGVRTFAEATVFLPADIAVYFVGGTEEDQRAMQLFIQEKKLPHITLVPHQTPDKVPLYLRAADVLVLPNTATEEASRVETSPVKLFEYMAASKPIVASDLPSIRDIVSEREVFFAKPDDPRDFARAIQEAFSSGAERARSARQLSLSHSWEARANKIGYFMEHTL